MLIHGLQKMTLLDYPGHIACTVFLGGCDFRCPYCHNMELVDGSAPAVMDEKEFLAFLDKRKGLLDGVAITGGEPLMRPELGDFIRQIREKGFLIKLDTNGYHPDRLKEILSEGLVDYVAMDVKNSLPKYGTTVGVERIDTDKIKESIDIIMGSGIDYEFRTTVVSEYHDSSDFEAMGEMIKGAKSYYLQQYTLRDTVPDKTLHSPSEAEMEIFLTIAKKYVDSASIRGV